MDLDALFNDDYDFFYAAQLTPAIGARDVDAVWRALQPQRGQSVLDLVCGADRLAAPLAARASSFGCRRRTSSPRWRGRAARGRARGLRA